VSGWQLSVKSINRGWDPEYPTVPVWRSFITKGGRGKHRALHDLSHVAAPAGDDRFCSKYVEQRDGDDLEKVVEEVLGKRPAGAV